MTEYCGTDQNTLFKRTGYLMGNSSSVTLPQFTSAEPLADMFSNFFPHMMETPLP